MQIQNITFKFQFQYQLIQSMISKTKKVENKQVLEEISLLHRALSHEVLCWLHTLRAQQIANILLIQEAFNFHKMLAQMQKINKISRWREFKIICANINNLSKSQINNMKQEQLFECNKDKSTLKYFNSEAEKDLINAFYYEEKLEQFRLKEPLPKNFKQILLIFRPIQANNIKNIESFLSEQDSEEAFQQRKFYQEYFITIGMILIVELISKIKKSYQVYKESSAYKLDKKNKNAEILLIKTSKKKHSKKKTQKKQKKSNKQSEKSKSTATKDELGTRQSDFEDFPLEVNYTASKELQNTSDKTHSKITTEIQGEEILERLNQQYSNENNNNISLQSFQDSSQKVQIVASTNFTSDHQHEEVILSDKKIEYSSEKLIKSEEDKEDNQNNIYKFVKQYLFEMHSKLSVNQVTKFNEKMVINSKIEQIYFDEMYKTSQNNLYRERLIQLFQQFFIKYDYKAEILGSSAYNTHLYDSDLDFVVIFEKNHMGLPLQELRYIEQLLQREFLGGITTSLKNYEYPILKIIPNVAPNFQKIEIDISVKYTDNISQYNNLRSYICQQIANPLLYKTIIFLKKILKDKGINKAYSGGLNSISQIYLVIAYQKLLKKVLQDPRSLYKNQELESSTVSNELNNLKEVCKELLNNIGSFYLGFNQYIINFPIEEFGIDLSHPKNQVVFPFFKTSENSKTIQVKDINGILTSKGCYNFSNIKNFLKEMILFENIQNLKSTYYCWFTLNQEMVYNNLNYFSYQSIYQSTSVNFWTSNRNRFS